MTRTLSIFAACFVLCGCLEAPSSLPPRADADLPGDDVVVDAADAADAADTADTADVAVTDLADLTDAIDLVDLRDLADEGSGCADCIPGETRCESRPDGRVAHQICSVDRDGDDPGCSSWTTQELCSDVQTCEAATGCVCSNTCELDGEILCEGGGAFACVLVDGCPQSVDVSRNDQCDSPDGIAGFIDCDDDPTSSHCRNGCGVGRSCVDVCDGAYHCQ